VRFRQDYTANQRGNLILSDNNSDRFAMAYGEGLIANPGANNARGYFSVKDAGGADRSVFEYGGTNTFEFTNDSTGVRKSFETDNNLWRLYGQDSVERVRVNSNSGDAIFAPIDSVDADNGGIQLRANDGGIEISSRNDGNSYVDFKGSGSLANDYEGRILYSDTNDYFYMSTAGTAGGASGSDLRLGRQVGGAVLSLAGPPGADEGGQITLQAPGSGQATGASAERNNSWSMDNFRNRWRLFNGSGGNAQVMIGDNAGSAGKIRIGDSVGAGFNHNFLPTPLAAGACAGGPCSSLDVDDIYLRGRGVWLSDVTEFNVVGTDAVFNTNSVPAAVTNRCTTSNGSRTAVPLYVATPAWWSSPAMMSTSELLSNAASVTGVRTLLPTGGVASNAQLDNYTEVQVYMAGSQLRMRGRQKNDNTWREVLGGVGIVTVFCQIL
ncbi:MAG: hypothetical protein AAF213_11905, partial [Pseudomonadota bacterium]